MSYTKIVQYGDIVELYRYEKPTKPPKRPWSYIKPKRYTKPQKHVKRSLYSRRRATREFIRLCRHNVMHPDTKTITFVTLTFIYDITLPKAYRALSDCMARIRRQQNPSVRLSYIAVPERTKKDRIHFHLLLFNRPTKHLSLIHI